MADEKSAAGLIHIPQPELAYGGTLLAQGQGDEIISSSNGRSKGGNESQKKNGKRESTKISVSDEEAGSISGKKEGDGQSSGGNDSRDPSPRTPPSLLSRRIWDILILICIIVMLVWPWAFWGTVRDLKGTRITNGPVRRTARRHPQSTTFFVSLIGNFICLLVDILFSLAVIRFAQEWVSERNKVSVFHVTVLNAFRHHSFPWRTEDVNMLLKKARWLPVVLVGVCIGAFQFVPSGVTSLLLPVTFERMEILEGRELDFSSTVPECVEWLDANVFSNDCDWKDYKGSRYTTCIGQNQAADILAAGRSSIVSLVQNNTEVFSLSQLGGRNGMRILGPLRGILPIGPNGAPAFDTLILNETSIFRDTDFSEVVIAYNYTLDYQGLSSNVTCMFEDESPVDFSPVPDDPAAFMAWVDGTCPDGMDFLPDRNLLGYEIPNVFNSLGYWACKAPPTESGLPSYSIYIRGRENYAETIGNLTCNISPIQTAIYPVTYQSQARVFRSETSTSTLPHTYTGLIEQLLVSLGGVMRDLQNGQAHLIAESVITFGVKSFDLSPTERMNDTYLPLWSAMFEGMLDYEASYSRLLYSTIDDWPASCVRPVQGYTNYTVFGWTAKLEHIGFLMPMTILNLVSLVIILTVIIITKPNVPQLFNPTSVAPLLYAGEPKGNEGDDELDRTVDFSRTIAINQARQRLEGAVLSGGAIAEVVPSLGGITGSL